MQLTRRDALAMGAGATIAAALGITPARAAVDDAIAAFTGGAEISDGGVNLTAPEIAENGNTVSVAAESAGAASIMLLATGNPNPLVATVSFGPLAGAQSLATRIRLAKTQDVVAIAKMPDGSFKRATSTVKVTIGGCGG